MLPVAAVITDIEGTTTPIAFVRDTLFPYARAHLADFLKAHATDEPVAAELAEVRRLSHGKSEIDMLLHWMDVDAKVTPLKAIQGKIWGDGYARGDIKGDIYPDVPGCLRAWRTAGLRLYVYSSGSVEAQKLIFGHSNAGDLSALFDGYFDTRVGNKREPDSYGRLAIALNLPPPEVLFLSDIEEELDAASTAGLRTCQLVRDADGTEPSDRHATAPDFPAVATRMKLLATA